MKKIIALRFVTVIVGLFSAGVISATTICGFLINPGGCSYGLYIADSQGVWEITTYKAQINIEYGSIFAKCACLSGNLDKKNQILGEIKSMKYQSMDVCENDPKLMAKQRDLYEQIK